MRLGLPAAKQKQGAAEDIVASCKQWEQRWEVVAVKRGSTDVGAAAQAAKALAALSSLISQAAARRRGAPPPPAVVAAAGAALRDLLAPLLASRSGGVAGAALAGAAAIARAAPGALALEAAAPLVALLPRDEEGPKAAWVLERCLSSGAWRAADVWAAAAAAGAREAFWSLAERQAAEWRRGGPAFAGDGGGCRLQWHVALMATLAAAAPRIASEILGASEAEAARALDALAAVHAGCAAHDATSDGAVRLLAALSSCAALGRLLGGGGGGGRGPRARALVLRVLHGTLKRPLDTEHDTPEHVRLWIRAASLASMPQLWQGAGDPAGCASDAAGCAGNLGAGADAGGGPGAARCRAEIVEAAADTLIRAQEGDAPREAAAEAARLLAAAVLGGRPAREYGGKGRGPPGGGGGCGGGCGGEGEDALGVMWRGDRGYVLADALMLCALSQGAPRADAAAARAAWLLLRLSLASAPHAAAAAGGGGGGGAGQDGPLLLLLCSPVAPSPRGMVRALTCLSAQLCQAAAAAAAGAHGSVVGGGGGARRGGGAAKGGAQTLAFGEVAAGELTEALRRPIEPWRARSHAQAVADASWRALGVAALRLCGAEGAAAAEAAGRAAAGAALAAAAVVDGAAGLAAAGAGGRWSCQDMDLAEAMLAASQALALLAHGDGDGAAAGGADGGGGGGAPGWRAALEGAGVRGALEELVMLQPPPPLAAAEAGGGGGGGPHGDALGALVDGAVIHELCCWAAAALSLCFGQLGVRPRAPPPPAPGGEPARSAAAAGAAPWAWRGLPLGGEWPDVELVGGGGGWRAPAHGVALCCASPVLRERLAAAAAEAGAARGDANGGGGGGGGRLVLKLSGAIDRASLELVREWAYSGCAQLPAEAAPGAAGAFGRAAGPRQRLRQLARALRVPPLAALAAAPLPLPGQRLPAGVAAGEAHAAAAPLRGAVVELPSPGGPAPWEGACDGGGGGGAEGCAHPPVAQLLSQAHHLSQLIPREWPAPPVAAAPGERQQAAGAAAAAEPGAGAPEGARVAAEAGGAADAFADVWLAAPFAPHGGGGGGGRPARPAALLLPAHRLLLAARCPYLGAATSARWGGGAPSGGGGGGGSDASGGRPVVVLPDANEDVAWGLLRFLYGGGGALFAGAAGGGGAALEGAARPPGACAACRGARTAARLLHCAEPLLLPPLADTCDGALRSGPLLAPLPAACLAALLRDCADLGLAAAAEAVFGRLVELLLRRGPGAQDLEQTPEWGSLAPHLRQAVSQAVARRRREGGGADDDDDEGAAAAAAPPAAPSGPGPRGGVRRGGEEECGMERLLRRFQAAMACGVH
ncbi:MAG: hypothetical protein J3K34DRAFT_476975 [Monoraphidium minutum]|nr:MAG: hypothetical protein J3K34DRAFT_476975 [Monoraphidium minutum]